MEGANTLTRSLIIFGQGLIRSHPNLLNIIHSIEKGNDEVQDSAALPWSALTIPCQEGFKKHVTSLLKHAAGNGLQSVVRAVTR